MSLTQFPLADALRDRLREDIEGLAEGTGAKLLDAVTPITSELLRFWFQRDYCDLRGLNFHSGQRAAIINVIYAHEVVNAPDLRALYEHLAPEALLGSGLMTEVSKPIHSHPKYAAKMATGTGKTWVLDALLIWQFLNRISDRSDHRFTSNFLLVAPGLVVYDRLLDAFLGKEREGERRFEDSDIFVNRELFVPDQYRDSVFGFLRGSVATKDDIGRKVTGAGVVAITNWHLLAGEEDSTFVGDVEAPGADIDARAAVEGMFPIQPGTAAGNTLESLDRGFLRGTPLASLKELPDLMVFNDEAHHIHELQSGGDTSEVEWQRSLSDIAATKGHRFVQIDFSATPFNEVGKGKARGRQYFPHIVVDFDLVAAMEAGLVKSLALDKRKEIASLPLDFRAHRDESGDASGLSEGQRVMLRAGLRKLEMLEEHFRKVDATKHPKLMVICEDTTVTAHVVEFLHASGLAQDDVLAIDSNRKGEMTKLQWAKARERLFDIDRHAQPRVIVSVLMLREGFDVNNICVIVPLRASEAQILLEQTIGRGLRLMWRGDPEIEDAKAVTRARFKQRLEPNNFFDVLFVVEHPAFAKFYEELVAGGLAASVSDDADKTRPTGDVVAVPLKPDFELFDFRIPFVVRESEAELKQPSLDPMTLPPCKFEAGWLLEHIGKGDRFVSEEAQSGTQFGDYRVDGGVMTATGYNEYLGRMTRRVAEAVSGTGRGSMSQSAKKYSEISRFPFLQVQLPLLTRWIDQYIRGRLFGVAFEPLEAENWRALLIDDVASHVAGTFATALVESAGNVEVEEAEVYYRRLSEVETITVRESSCLYVTKSIYPRLPVPTHAGGLERTFIEWADRDTQVDAFTRINEYKHDFLRRRYLKADGMPALYSPDFLLRSGERIFVIETKAQSSLTDENVNRKRRAAVAWCDQLNGLPVHQRDGKVWSYVILGESAVKEWKTKNARVTELLEYARLRRNEGRAEAQDLF
ncbi:MAG: DEAD/DEAH box helicase family protein [Candidatus Dormibacteria bacterium]